jgi:hypothetical protein
MNQYEKYFNEIFSRNSEREECKNATETLPDRIVGANFILPFLCANSFTNPLSEGSEIINQSEQKDFCAISGVLGIFSSVSLIKRYFGIIKK